jgi:hypothetical protein
MSFPIKIYYYKYEGDESDMLIKYMYIYAFLVLLRKFCLLAYLIIHP